MRLMRTIWSFSKSTTTGVSHSLMKTSATYSRDMIGSSRAKSSQVTISKTLLPSLITYGQTKKTANLSNNIDNVHLTFNYIIIEVHQYIWSYQNCQMPLYSHIQG